MRASVGLLVGVLVAGVLWWGGAGFFDGICGWMTSVGGFVNLWGNGFPLAGGKAVMVVWVMTVVSAGIEVRATAWKKTVLIAGACGVPCMNVEWGKWDGFSV